MVGTEAAGCRIALGRGKGRLTIGRVRSAGFRSFMVIPTVPPWTAGWCVGVRVYNDTLSYANQEARMTR